LAALAAFAAIPAAGPAAAQPLAVFSPSDFQQGGAQQPMNIAPQTDAARSADAIGDEDAELPARLRKQIVDYPSREAPGTIIVDTPHTYLYYVLGHGKALRYGIGVGREGFTWSGVKSITRKAEWPDWYPPAEMIARQPYLPRMTAGGPGNPLGARAMYIGGTEYRIHGTNDPTTIGKHVSSGCIRLTNEDVIDLFSRVNVGAKVIVLPQTREARAPALRRVSDRRVTPTGDGLDAFAQSPPDGRPLRRVWITTRPTR
jgi:lipoprotein-anchoring transpeptidase ErfK/SrfK